jgi:hypothetical protein
MRRFPASLRGYLRFSTNESGAVATDWVVLTSAVVGVAISVTATVFEGVGGHGARTAATIESASPLADEQAPSAVSYFEIGIAKNPTHQRRAWRTARMAVQLDAPAGFDYNPEFDETRYVDTPTGLPIYVSQDGALLSIGGTVVAAAEYDRRNRTTFKRAFDDYWTATR